MSGAQELREAIEALQMPPAVLRRWLEARRDWCLAHGGRRVYGDVLDLLEDCLRLAGSC